MKAPYRFVSLSLLLCLLAAGCEVITSESIGQFQQTLQSNITPVIVTQEVVVKTVEQVVVTTTPLPTPTRTPVPAFMGAPVQADAALQRAVVVSLAALSEHMQLLLFTRAPNGELVAWVRDRQHPDTLLCGAPLYFPGLGSLLVLTTGNLYKTINEQKVFLAQNGCVAVSLERGREQVRKILENYQGIYHALRTDRRFSSVTETYAYIKDYITKSKDQFPYELNLVIVPMIGEDLGRTSVPLECPRDFFQGDKCQGAYQYDFTGQDISYEGSSIRHVPLAYARFFDQASVTDTLPLLGERARQMQTGAPSTSLLRTNPLTRQEILSLWFDQNFWEQMVYSGAVSAGLGKIFPYLDARTIYTNAVFVPLLPLTGVNHIYDAALNQNWVFLSNYLDGKTKQLSSSYADAYIQSARARLKNTYFDFVIFDDQPAQ